MSKIKDLLMDGTLQVHFGWLGKEVTGKIELSTGHITLNVITMIVYTFIHEVLHYYFPDRSEMATRVSAHRLMKKMTREEIEDLYAIIKVAGRWGMRKNVPLKKCQKCSVMMEFIVKSFYVWWYICPQCHAIIGVRGKEK